MAIIPQKGVFVGLLCHPSDCDRLNVTAASTNQSSVSIVYQGKAVDLQPAMSRSFALSDITPNVIDRNE
jgi:hypothetical protein